MRWYRPCLCNPARRSGRNLVLCRRSCLCSHSGQICRTTVPCSRSHRRTSPDQMPRSDRRAHSFLSSRNAAAFLAWSIVLIGRLRSKPGRDGEPSGLRLNDADGRPFDAHADGGVKLFFRGGIKAPYSNSLGGDEMNPKNMLIASAVAMLFVTGADGRSDRCSCRPHTGCT
jgi:hypothetical protein